MDHTGHDRRTAGVCLLLAAALLLLCSRSSPLYPLNDWMDANAFYTVGKAMMNGLVPYRDVFDHKGPLLHLLYGLAWLVDRHGFFGVFLLETAAFAAFLFFGWRCVQLFVSDVHPLWMALPGACVAASRAFVQGGSAEELCLPLLAVAAYIALAFFCLPAPQRRPMPGGQVLLAGVLAGCVLWIKYTILGLFIGWTIAMAAAYLRRGWYKELVRSCGLFLGGMLLATLPWGLYFGLNGALGDWWQVYFYDNLFLYAGRDAATGAAHGLLALAQKLWWGCHDSPLLAAAALAGGAAVLCRVRKAGPGPAAALVALAAGQALGLAGGRYLIYYFLPFSVWVPLGLVPLLGLVRRCMPAARRRVSGLVGLAAALALCLFASPNAPYRLRPRQALPQFRFAAQLAPGQTLLNYNALDGGFYTAAGLLPPCKYFYVTGMPLPEQREQQAALLRQGGVDYMVALEKDLEQTFPLYRCVDSASYEGGEGERTWYLYRRLP